MTITELLGLTTEQLEAMTCLDMEREFTHLLPSVRTPIEGMAGATDTAVKKAADNRGSGGAKLSSPKENKMDNMLKQLAAMQRSGQL